jgi:subtilisin family serine protease
MLSRLSALLLFLTVVLPGQFLANRFIVEFAEPPALRSSARLAVLRNRQADAEAQLRARGFRPLWRTVRVANTIAVEGDEQYLETLANLPGVARVHRVREFHKTLDTAAAVHGVTAIVRQLGAGQAGAGLKIGILDSGIEIAHPGFAPGELAALPGFPLTSNERDLAHTNAKVIVARSYASLFARPEPELSVRDNSGHGTAVAMAAAGTPHESPRGMLSGMAPAARLGVYKIFGTPGVNDSTTDAAILAAIEDAVSDGMDILNLSFGSPIAGRPEEDIVVRALARAEEAGVIVVVSAGNDGPGPATLGSPASAPTALTVGASENSRVFAAAVLLGNEVLLARTGSLTPNEGSLSARLVSVASQDATELACAPLPPGVFAGKAVLVARGECTFELKVTHATAAGATAVVLYSDAARPGDFITPALTQARLPTVFLTRADGLRLREELERSGEVSIELDFALNPRPVDPRRIAQFSSRGALPGIPPKPDLLAVGTNVYTAAQSNNPNGDVYASNGYATLNGTSFSSPIAAGIAALLKAARPGLSPADYRSLLISSSQRWTGSKPWDVAAGGAGLVSLPGALAAPLSFVPASTHFWADEHWIEVRNQRAEGVVYRLRVEASQGVAPELNATELYVPGMGSEHFRVSLNRASLEPGIHSGVVIFEADDLPSLRYPYFFGKPNSAAPASIQSLFAATGATANTNQRNLVFFRVLDANGLAIDQAPVVRVLAGQGSVREVQRRDAEALGAYGLDLVLGPGVNILEVDAGNGVTRRYTFVGR